MADKKKMNKEVDREIHGTLQSKKDHINQCSGTRITKDGQDLPSSKCKQDQEV